VVTSFITDVRDEPTPGELAIVDRALRAVVGETEADGVGASAPESVASEGEWALFDVGVVDVAESA